MLVAVMALFACTTPAQANLVWEDYYSDEDVIANNDRWTTSTGARVRITRRVYSDRDGGTYDLSLYNGNTDYLTFEVGQTGAHTGYVEFAMDNENNDPSDYIRLTLTFDTPVYNVQFSLLDVDSGTWDDGFEVYYNGSNNVRDNSSIMVVTHSANGEDNESYMHGWEGFGSNASDSDTTGNIDFDFGSLAITSLQFRYFSTDDADSDPGGQKAGLSDLAFTAATPEAPSLALMSVFGILTLLCRFRWKDRPVPSPSSMEAHVAVSASELTDVRKTAA